MYICSYKYTSQYIISSIHFETLTNSPQIDRHELWAETCLRRPHQPQHHQQPRQNHQRQQHRPDHQQRGCHQTLPEFPPSPWHVSFKFHIAPCHGCKKNVTQLLRHVLAALRSKILKQSMRYWMRQQDRTSESPD